MTPPYSKISLLLLFFLQTLFAYPQSATGFPFQTDIIKEKKLIEDINKRYETDIASITGKNKKYITDIYKERAEIIKNSFKEKEILLDGAALDYLNAIANEIFRGNPGINSGEVRILFSRSYIPNASSMGEGTILFNIGLFARLQNESEAAFIICHELAHYLLNHSNNSIYQYINTVYSDEFQKQLKSIKRTEYGSNKRLEELEQGLLFRSRRHSRNLEAAADSMALELIKNTRYDPDGILTCLAILDKSDEDNFFGSLNLEQRFNFPNYPFKEKWLHKEETLAFSETEKEKKEKIQKEDSLKTHPDCSIRINILTPKIRQYESQDPMKFVISENKFTLLKKAFASEILEYCTETDRISKSLFYALQMLDKFPDNDYLHTIVGRGLNKLYSSRKNHEAGKIIDLPDPKYNDEYNNLLNFIHNLNLTEISNLSFYFLTQNEAKFSNSPSFIKELTIAKENLKK